ncbi:MAG: hypothetical protein H6978_03275 [Gammaproteobacteria bacterium]|nr:hypothetical protein [Gammaproteobacteria bacterium]
MSTNRLSLLVCFATLLAAVIVFLPGMSGGFIYDDYTNILSNDFVRIDSLNPENLAAAATSGRAGPSGRPISMLSFAVNHAFAGSKPMAYKITNLVIHGINTMLVFWLVSLLMQTPALKSESFARGISVPALVALAFAVHPANISVVLYVVQRMTSLASLFVLAACCIYVAGRLRQLRGQPGTLGMLTAVSVMTVIGVFTKEIGALVPFLLLAIEFALLGFKTPAATDRRWLQLFYLGTVIVPLGFAVIYILTHPDWLPTSYGLRPYDLIERLLTELRVTWIYVFQVLLPAPSSFSIYHDDLVISRGMLTPATTLLSLAGWLAVIAASWHWRKSFPLLLFAVCWFWAGNLLESTFLPLLPMQDHRTYLPMIGLLVCLVAGLRAVVSRVELTKAASAVTAGWLLLLSLVGFIRAEQWSDPLTLAQSETANNPGSALAQYELARIMLGLDGVAPDLKFADQAIVHLQRATTLDPSFNLGLFGELRLDLFAHRTPDPAMVEELKHRMGTQPFHPMNIAALDNLIGCMRSNNCDADPQVMMSLYDAALSNDKMDDFTRAHLLRTLAVYYANEFNDLEAGMRITREIMGEYPQEYSFRANLIRMLIAAGDQQQALAEIAATREMLKSRSLTDLDLPIYFRQLDEIERSMAAN